MTAKSADFERLGDLLKGTDGPLGGAAAMEPRRGGAEGSAADSRVSVDGSGVTGGVARVLASIWTETVGGEVAANATPVQFRQGRLAVSVSSSAWAQTLQLMAEVIRDRLNERLGERIVSEVVFRHAGWEQSGHCSTTGGVQGEASAGTPRTLPAATPEEEHAIAEIRELGLEPALEDSILRAMLASLRNL